MQPSWTDAAQAPSAGLVVFPAAGYCHDSELARALAAHAAHFVQVLQRYGPLTKGAGTPAGGLAEFRALQVCKLELGNALAGLDSVLALDDRAALQPLAAHLGQLLECAAAYRLMRLAYEGLLQAALAAGHPELEGLCRYHLAQVCVRLGD